MTAIFQIRSPKRQCTRARKYNLSRHFRGSKKWGKTPESNNVRQSLLVGGPRQFQALFSPTATLPGSSSFNRNLPGEPSWRSHSFLYKSSLIMTSLLTVLLVSVLQTSEKLMDISTGIFPFHFAEGLRTRKEQDPAISKKTNVDSLGHS